MKKISINSLDDNKTLKHVPSFNRDWNKTIRLLSALDVEIIESYPKEITHNHWALFIEEVTQENDKKVNYRQLNKRLNNDIENNFINLVGLDEKHWNQYFSKFKFSGFYVPIDDIQNINASTLRSHLYFYQFLIKYFPYKDYFISLKLCQSNLKENESLAPSALFYFIYFYAKFLRKLKNKFPHEYASYSHWYTEHLDQNNFYRRLPSEQIAILLLNNCESAVARSIDEQKDYPNASNGSAEVKAFFEKHKEELSSLYSTATTELNPVSPSIGHQEMIREIGHIFLKDSDELLIQDLLDNRSKLNISSVLPFRSQLRYGPRSLFNFTGRIKDSLSGTFKKSAGNFLEDDASQPKFRRIKKKIYPSDVQYWFNLTTLERHDLLNSLNQLLPTSLLDECIAACKKRTQNHWLNLLNLTTGPILHWITTKDKLLPQWNLFEDIHANTLKAKHNKRKKVLAQEKILLEKHLNAIYKLQAIEELTTYLEELDIVFSDLRLHEKWTHEVNRMEKILRQREKFYQSRMKEFGISESNVIDSVKRLWLREMLTIEDEIKPYINYVKKAFQTALPIRKRVVFSDYRHVSDGVEFDPDTLFDHEKWIRANVMKVMQTKIDRGEAIQINTFCLDFSGSMDNLRMRNLFKVLYLLVLGLEDRKSFDAFHFFSDRFIDVVDFSNEFTNKKVLYRILRQITTIHFDEIFYGGIGGTNMSDGIGMSHKKMKTFIEAFRKINPEANIVSSIFVITDGEPSLGITDIPELKEFIESIRNESEVEIKGIFITSEDDIKINMMQDIFGEDHFVETTDFQEGVNKFVKIMTETYKLQRKEYKWKQKKRKLGLSN